MSRRYVHSLLRNMAVSEGRPLEIKKSIDLHGVVEVQYLYDHGKGHRLHVANLTSKKFIVATLPELEQIDVPFAPRETQGMIWYRLSQYLPERNQTMKTKYMLQSGNRVRNALSTKKEWVTAILLEVQGNGRHWEVAHRVRIGPNPGQCPTKEEALRSCQDMRSYYLNNTEYHARIVRRSERVISEN